MLCFQCSHFHITAILHISVSDVVCMIIELVNFDSDLVSYSNCDSKFHLKTYTYCTSFHTLFTLLFNFKLLQSVKSCLLHSYTKTGRQYTLLQYISDHEFLRALNL